MAAHVARSDAFARAARVALYAALPDELPLHEVAALARRLGQVLSWPRVDASGEIELACAEERDLVPDAKGVLAPPADRPAIRLGPGDVVFVPGVAFTRSGQRLGRGGGHYDRLLSRAAGAISIGVAFDIQLVEWLPVQPHDRRVDRVATPSGIWRAER